MKWNVGTKLGVGFGLALLIMVAVGIVSYRATTQLIAASDERKKSYDIVVGLTEIFSLVKDLQSGQRGYVITGDENYLEPYNQALPLISGTISELRALIKDNPYQQALLIRLEPLINERMELSRQIIDARRAEGLEAASLLIKTGKGKANMDKTRELLSEMKKQEEGSLDRWTKQAADDSQRAEWTIMVGTLSALVVAALAGVVITRNIARPLQSLTSAAERITLGDLNVNVASNGRADEVGVLARTFDRMTLSLKNMAGAAEKIAAGELSTTVKPQSPEDQLGNAFARMSDNLREQIRGIVEGAATLGTAANEIVASTSQLTSTSSESAAAVSETTTTVEEVRQTAQVASQKAKTVSDTSQKAAQICVTGRKSAEDAINGMNRIRQQMGAIAESMIRLSEQTQTIGQIIATVEDLAAQSNLLAVNAAIEAAKAGEHGKGFGVVAQEVKSLAEQSRQATNQVRAILGDIQKATTAAVMATEQGTKAVESGEIQTGAAGESIMTLAGSVSEAAQAATQIAASSQQQLVGMDQVAIAMENIKQASTQNVASAKQLEVAARNLSDLGLRLKQMVERYKI